MEIVICTYCSGFGYTERMDRIDGELVPVNHECKACEGHEVLRQLSLPYYARRQGHDAESGCSLRPVARPEGGTE